MKIARLLACLAALLIPAAGCRRGAPAAAQARPQTVTLGPADATVAVEGRIASGPALSGTLTPRRQATVRAQVGGEVEEARVAEGEPVAAGEVLARIAQGSLDDAVRSARAAAENARNALGLARREAARQRSLLAAGAVSQHDVETAEQQARSAQAGLAQARAQLAAAEVQLGNAVVRAPFAGLVSAKQVSAGDVVQTGAALYTIVDPSLLELAATVPAEALADLRVGLAVEFTVTGFPGRTFAGRVSRINPSADPATRQVRVYAELPNPAATAAGAGPGGPRLVSGLYAEGRITSQAHLALTLPGAAIDRTLQQPAVETVQGGRVVRAEVTLGTVDEQADRVEVKSGVAPGEVVLVGPARDIPPGTAVVVSPALQTRLAQMGGEMGGPRL